jgi:integrase
VPIDSASDFYSALTLCAGTAARALEFTLLTAARSGEVRGATWAEIDSTAGVWTIPADRMKAKKEHRVPLSKAAIQILRDAPRITDNDLVFAAPRGGKLSDMSLTAVMRRMKSDCVPHGLRSTFRDWAAERTAYPRELAEMALAHALDNKVEAAYRRGDLLEKRRAMMEDWHAFLTTTVRDVRKKS